jgi:hypothetical protein
VQKLPPQGAGGYLYRDLVVVTLPPHRVVAVRPTPSHPRWACGYKHGHILHNEWLSAKARQREPARSSDTSRPRQLGTQVAAVIIAPLISESAQCLCSHCSVRIVRVRPHPYNRPHRTRNAPPGDTPEASRMAAPCWLTDWPHVAAAPRAMGLKQESVARSRPAPGSG